jgi:hypothetical protein
MGSICDIKYVCRKGCRRTCLTDVDRKYHSRRTVPRADTGGWGGCGGAAWRGRAQLIPRDFLYNAISFFKCL